VPERGLITDFLTKVKRYVRLPILLLQLADEMDSRKVTRDYQVQNDAAFAAQRKASMQNFVTHSFQQQQAALNLALLAKKEQ
nr:hypothetical protein [Tanacetum cinerariifolium]